jgi:hypothetical protein
MKKRGLMSVFSLPMVQFLLFGLLLSITGCAPFRPLATIPSIPNYRAVKLLPLPNHERCEVKSINNANPPIAVGVSTDASGRQLPVYWVVNNDNEVIASRLVTEAPFRDGEAVKVTDGGRVCGTLYSDATRNYVPVWWSSVADEPVIIRPDVTVSNNGRNFALTMTDDTIISIRTDDEIRSLTFGRVYFGSRNVLTGAGNNQLFSLFKLGSGDINGVSGGQAIKRVQGELRTTERLLLGLSELGVEFHRPLSEHAFFSQVIVDTTLDNAAVIKLSGAFVYDTTFSNIKRPQRPLFYQVRLLPNRAIDSTFTILPFISGDTSAMG